MMMMMMIIIIIIIIIIIKFTLSNNTVLTDVGLNLMSIYRNPQVKLYTTT